MDAPAPYPILVILSILVLIWIFFWKGIALWYTAKYNQRKWFIFLVITTFPGILLNALGVVDLTYLYFFAKKRLTVEEMKTWKSFFVKKTSHEHKKLDE